MSAPYKLRGMAVRMAEYLEELIGTHSCTHSVNEMESCVYCNSHAVLDDFEKWRVGRGISSAISAPPGSNEGPAPR